MSVSSHYVMVDEVNQRFCPIVHNKLAQFVQFRSRQPFSTRFPRYTRNLLVQRERVFHSVTNPLSNTSYENISPNIDCHLKKFWISRERTLAKLSPTKQVYQLIRSKLKMSKVPPNIEVAHGRICSRHGSKLPALGCGFASVLSF